LDEQGRRDAAKLGESLLNDEWDMIVSSDLSRAKETAEIIGRILHIDVKTDPRLREAGGGQIEGTTEQERIEKWGEKWRELDLGIEKEELVVARAHEALNDLHHQHPGHNILIVSH
ncbi:histidine phosphatase family protein, partial [Micrococcus sp. SIMBA_131]